MTLSNLLKCWLSDNADLVSVRFQRCWEQKGNTWLYFWRKILNKCEMVDFLQIRHIFIVEIGRASDESWTKQGTYCTLSCNRSTAMRLCQDHKWPVKQKNLISTPASASKCYYRLVFFWFPWNIFRADNMDRLHVAISGDPRQLVVTELTCYR